ncbi:MAG: hypothetical protein Q3993_08515 [Filifactor alocis]|nr:hypothetical protein [Filifactor alocis]
MKKVLYFVPAILFLMFLIWAVFRLGIGSIEPTAALFALFLMTAGALLGMGSLIGALVGISPALYLISFGRDTKTGVEFYVGLFLLIYYALCGYGVWSAKRGRRETDKRI